MFSDREDERSARRMPDGLSFGEPWYAPSKSRVDAGRFSFRDACVHFYSVVDPVHAGRRKLHRAEWISRTGGSALVHGYEERTSTWTISTHLRAARSNEREALLQCERRPLALAVMLSANNMFHQAFHAVPAYEALGGVAESGSRASDVTFVPLVGPMAGRWIGSNGTGASVLEGTRGGLAGWEFTIRALTRRSGERIDAEVRSLLASPCVCFDRVEGSTGGFSLYVHDPAERARAGRWRDAMVAHLHPTGWASGAAAAAMRMSSAGGAAGGGGDATGPLLYVVRVSGTRVVTNEGSLASGLERFGAKVHRVIMERMTLVEQMRLASTSSGLVGVHGQALALLTVLPWTTTRAALVEIRPRPSKSSYKWKEIFPDWASALGIRYLFSVANLADTPSCKPDAKRSEGGTVLRCNVTAHVASVASAVDVALAHVEGRQEPPRRRADTDPSGWKRDLPRRRGQANATANATRGG